MEQLFTAVEASRDRAIFSLMLKAGLRVSEIVDLQLTDLDLGAPTPLVRLRVRGKGDKERVVWLTADVMQQVECWLNERPQADRPYLFFNQHGRPLSVSGVQFRLKQYCLQAGVQLSCHQLRHTFGRPFGRLVNASLDAIRHQRRIFSPWRFSTPSRAGLVSFQGTRASRARETGPQ